RNTTIRLSCDGLSLLVKSCLFGGGTIDKTLIRYTYYMSGCNFIWISLAAVRRTGQRIGCHCNTRVVVIDFLGIYLRDTIYLDAPLIVILSRICYSILG
ncbi:MAG: hypothetical protein H6Q57_2182, partial [Geobacteraceae bacterium]|nr:hypothetical protein [Geobacteraceae bacterium]